MWKLTDALSQPVRDGLGYRFILGNKLTVIKFKGLESKISLVNLGATLIKNITALNHGMSNVEFLHMISGSLKVSRDELVKILS